MLVVFWWRPCAIQHGGRGASPTGLPLALTFAVFIGVHVATRLGWSRAPDGKLMVGLAAFAPLALGLGVLLEAVVFIVLRRRGRRDAPLPGALWFYTGSVLSAAAQVILASIAVRASAPVML